MNTIQFHMPDSLQTDFDRYFAGEEPAVVHTRLLAEAIEASKRKAQLPERRAKAINAILEFRKNAPRISDEEIFRLRQEYRE